MARGRTPLTQGQFTAADFEAAKAEPVILAAQRSSQWKASQFVWQVRKELTTKLCPDAETCPPIERGGLTITTTLDMRLQEIAEKWVKAATVVPNSKNPRVTARALGLRYESVDGEPAVQGPPQRRARRHGLPDGRPGGLRGIGGSERPEGHPQVPAPVRRARRWLAAARLGVQAGRLLHGHREQEHHGGLDVHGRRHQLRRRLHADRCRQPRARPGPDARRPQLLAQHPGREGRDRDRQRPGAAPGRGDGHRVPGRPGRRRRGVPTGGRGGPSAGPGPGLRRPRRSRAARRADDPPDRHRQQRRRC